MKKYTVILLVLATGMANGQIRQRSVTKGLNVAAKIHSLGWSSDYFSYLDEHAGSGIGGGLRVGYGITELFEPYVGVDFTGMKTSDIDARSFSMTHVDVGLRLNFAGTINRIRPFVEGGYGFRKGTIKHVINGNSYDDVSFSGGTPHAGGGVSFFPNVPFSVFAEGIFTLGKNSTLTLNDSKTSDKPDVTTFRIAIGVSFNLAELMAGKK